MSPSTAIAQILAKQKENGGPFWSRTDGDIHAPHGSSTIDTLMVLGELGAKVDTTPPLAKAVEFVFKYQSDDGSFKYGRSSSNLPCMTSRILAALGRLGATKDKRSERSYLQLLNTQWSDGGWRCRTVRLGKSAQSDASNPGTTLYVLDAFRFRNSSQKERAQLEQGVRFLLQHWETRQPLGPCDFGIGSRFLQVEYPFLRYNLFYYVYVLSFYNQAIRDHRFHDSYQELARKLKNGEIVLDNPHKSWRDFDFAQAGQVSKLATKHWKEVEKNVQKNGTEKPNVQSRNKKSKKLY